MDIKKESLLKKLIEAKGIVSTACINDNTPRSTYYLWYNSDNDFKIAVDDINNVVLDFAESKLYDLVDKGDTTATIFLLKTRGKKRGYIERADDTAPSIVINTTVSKEEALDIYKTISENC